MHQHVLQMQCHEHVQSSPIDHEDRADEREREKNLSFQHELKIIITIIIIIKKSFLHSTNMSVSSKPMKKRKKLDHLLIDARVYLLFLLLLILFLFLLFLFLFLFRLVFIQLYSTIRCLSIHISIYLSISSSLDVLFPSLISS